MKLGTYYDEQYTKLIASLSPTTINGYESSYHAHVEQQWAGWEMHEIRVKHINAWLATEFEGNPGGAEKAYKVLRQIIRAAIADEEYPEDVVDPTTRGVRLPKKPYPGEPEIYTPRETKELLRALYGWEYEAVAICDVWTGPRRCEACGLQWGDPNLSTGIVYYLRGMHYIKGKIVVTPVKTHRSQRPNMIPRMGVERLREIKREIRPKPTDWMLGPDPNPDRYARRLKAHCKRMGVRYIPPKQMRHTFSANSHKAGATDGEIQKMLGHKEFSTTFRNYMTLDEDMLRTRSRELERVIARS